MKKTNRAASLLGLLTTVICSAAPAFAQDFLTTQTAQAPTFLNNAFSSSGAQGVANNASNLLTGPGAFNAGVVGGRSLSLPQAGFANLGQQSVNTSAFPSGQFNYGFNQPAAVTIYPGGGNHWGSYAGQSLPSVSTGSVDINTVDCPYLRGSYGVNGFVANPWILDMNIFGTKVPINFQETASDANSFLNGILDNW